MNGTRRDPVSIHYMEREVEMYSLTKSEIRQLSSGEGSLELSMACTAIGIACTGVVTLFTAQLSASLFASFVATTVCMLFIAIYSALKFIRMRRKAAESVAAIIGREASPVTQFPGYSSKP